MNIRSAINATLLLCLSWMPAAANALDIKVVDQSGDPVKDAFVALPDGKITNIPSEPAIMDQVDVTFVPHVLAIEQGRQVIFPNSDNIRHHVYSFSEPKRFEIKLYKGDPNTPILFDQPGLVALGCNIHDSMLGYIFVSPWPTFQVTDGSGEVSFTQNANSNSIAVWHPWLKDTQEPMMIRLSEDEWASGAVITLTLTPPKPIKRFKKKYKKRYND
ncbi:methylamine utilization protein [Litoribrevibacter albus]|uniref:Methylamine utilization protein n=1 Tax=Litoribrevibacter albus TaxID=1473156 RepID=A0AA37S5I0_9GAMM|nr:methylamine utilization protein [Litoribrevibacter albus]GLQ29655.1 hypothetical protein GCM10007876_01330 [Litoribrevibacter albus]